MLKNKVKCVVFDLDNTIWHGTILEHDKVTLNESILKIIKFLDKQGILLSIASKGNEEIALKKLEEFGILEYFLYPQINWNDKYESLLVISNTLNINVNSLAFVDDDKYELKQVSLKLKDVLCLKDSELSDFIESLKSNKDYYSIEDQYRRKYYIADKKFRDDRDNYLDNINMFFSQIKMNINIDVLKIEDMPRAIQLINKTSKLNSIGKILTQNQFEHLLDKSIGFKINYKDIYGDYGNIGTIILENRNNTYNFKLVVFSCRTISRNICSYILLYIIKNLKYKNQNIFVRFNYIKSNGILLLYLEKCGFSKYNDDKYIYCNSLKSCIPEYIKFTFPKKGLI